MNSFPFQYLIAVDIPLPAGEGFFLTVPHNLSKLEKGSRFRSDGRTGSSKDMYSVPARLRSSSNLFWKEKKEVGFPRNRLLYCVGSGRTGLVRLARYCDACFRVRQRGIASGFDCEITPKPGRHFWQNKKNRKATTNYSLSWPNGAVLPHGLIYRKKTWWDVRRKRVGWKLHGSGWKSQHRRCRHRQHFSVGNPGRINWRS